MTFRSENLANKKFGMWTVLNYAGNSKWSCICECGKKSLVTKTHLKSGHSQSCGCLHKEKIKKLKTIHNEYGSPEYITWQNMKKRCLDIKQKHYKDYGGRGIKVCDRWLESFENFLEDMGKRPSNKFSIERINNNGNYEPSNCKWATQEEQKLNKRLRKDTVFYKGKTVAEWAVILNVSTCSVYNRLKRIGTPYLKKQNYIED